jgi:hypothetical protein
MCKGVGVGGKERTTPAAQPFDSANLLFRLAVLVGEWDRSIRNPATDRHEEEHRHVMLQCREQLARLIGVKEFGA